MSRRLKLNEDHVNRLIDGEVAKYLDLTKDQKNVVFDRVFDRVRRCTPRAREEGSVSSAR